MSSEATLPTTASILASLSSPRPASRRRRCGLRAHESTRRPADSGCWSPQTRHDDPRRRAARPAAGGRPDSVLLDCASSRSPAAGVLDLGPGGLLDTERTRSWVTWPGVLKLRTDRARRNLALLGLERLRTIAPGACRVDQAQTRSWATAPYPDSGRGRTRSPRCGSNGIPLQRAHRMAAREAIASTDCSRSRRRGHDEGVGHGTDTCRARTRTLAADCSDRRPSSLWRSRSPRRLTCASTSSACGSSQDPGGSTHPARRSRRAPHLIVEGHVGAPALTRRPRRATSPSWCRGVLDVQARPQVHAEARSARLGGRRSRAGSPRRRCTARARRRRSSRRRAGTPAPCAATSRRALRGEQPEVVVTVRRRVAIEVEEDGQALARHEAGAAPAPARTASESQYQLAYQGHLRDVDDRRRGAPVVHDDVLGHARFRAA